MNEHEQSQGEKGEFFAMNILQIDSMVRADAGAEDVMAYLVLARGVNKRGGKSISTHGAKSVANRTGMSYRKAASSLEWLAEHGYIKSAEAGKEVPQHLGKGEGRGHLARWVLVVGVDQDDIFLANALIEGIGQGKKNPPMTRIYNEASNKGRGLPSIARLDALMVLLHLYRHQDMADCGGIDPRAGIYREWVAAENSEGAQVTDIEGSNAALFEIEGGNRSVFNKFAAEALFYVEAGDERDERLWDALNNLHSLGFLYEVTQVWSNDPNGKNGRKAELLYTLYIHDRHARESEPYLSRDVHIAAFNSGAMDDYSEFPATTNDYFGDSANIVGTGRFRYIATRKHGGFPIGIYRLRFRPKTNDTGKGIEAERRRVGNWSASLRGLSKGIAKPVEESIPF